ncbi:MAG: hypothetical protein ACM31I_04855 [Deltaproteobacteria bacterium]
MSGFHYNSTIVDTPLRNSLWNLLYRVVSANDRSRTAWTALLRGACLAFFKQTIDDLPSADNDASMREFKRLFFGIPAHRVYDLFEFLLADDRGGMKELDRKLIRRGLNPVLEEDAAPVRLQRDRFVPLSDELSLDAVAGAGEALSLFDLAAARRHLESAVSFLSRRPDPATREAVREAVISVAAVVRSLRDAPAGTPPGAGEAGNVPESGVIAMGTIGPVREALAIDAGLAEAIDVTLSRCHALSGLPGAAPGSEPPDPAEATFLVVFCATVIRFLLSRAGPPGGGGGR